MENKKTDVVKNFAPSWFAVIMGTGIVPVALFFGQEKVSFLSQLAQIFFILNLVLYVGIFIPWSLKFIKHFENVKNDLMHPIQASFFPTFGIATMIVATNFVFFGEKFLSSTITWNIVTILFVIGTAYIVLSGFIIFPIIFIGNKTSLVHGNFAWLIPALSHMVIPIVGIDLVNHYKNTDLAIAFFVTSLIGFGIGLFLYIYIGSAVYHRYLYDEILMPKLAATHFIGLMPPALITIICVKVTVSTQSVAVLFQGIDVSTLLSLAKVFGIISWGFAMWWFVFAFIMIFYHIIQKKLPYGLSWWAFIFPTGVLAVSTGVINLLLKLPFFDYTLIGLIIILLSIWSKVAYHTLRAVIDKSVFQA